MPMAPPDPFQNIAEGFRLGLALDQARTLREDRRSREKDRADRAERDNERLSIQNQSLHERSRIADERTGLERDRMQGVLDRANARADQTEADQALNTNLYRDQVVGPQLGQSVLDSGGDAGAFFDAADQANARVDQFSHASPTNQRAIMDPAIADMRTRSRMVQAQQLRHQFEQDRLVGKMRNIMAAGFPPEQEDMEIQKLLSGDRRAGDFLTMDEWVQSPDRAMLGPDVQTTADAYVQQMHKRPPAVYFSSIIHPHTTNKAQALTPANNRNIAAALNARKIAFTNYQNAQNGAAWGRATDQDVAEAFAAFQEAHRHYAATVDEEFAKQTQTPTMMTTPQAGPSQGAPAPQPAPQPQGGAQPNAAPTLAAPGSAQANDSATYNPDVPKGSGEAPPQDGMKMMDTPKSVFVPNDPAAGSTNRQNDEDAKARAAIPSAKAIFKARFGREPGPDDVAQYRQIMLEVMAKGAPQ